MPEEAADAFARIEAKTSSTEDKSSIRVACWCWVITFRDLTIVVLYFLGFKLNHHGHWGQLEAEEG